MKRILIPTDFSDNAWNAILYAIELFHHIPCEFYILNVYTLTSTSLVTTISSQKVGQMYDTVKKESKKGLVSIQENLKNSKVYSHHHFISVSKQGEPVDEIRQFVIEKRMDLIIMGTQGATGAKAIFLGSVTHKVVKTIKSCPVLVIPQGFYFDRLKAVGFATNFKRIFYKSEIDPIISLANMYGGIIRMIEIYKEPSLSPTQNYNANSLEHYFKNKPHEFHVLPDFDTIEKGIQAFIEELEIDMLVMINYQHSFIERLTREPVIKKMVFRTKVPLMVIPADEY
ncbi:hypothetical protein GCM10022393_10890 [Aquimarina addita]|uniref:UspA domain-containing protein n=1 Tax=Aquimarina addita TaxID=870485 RepID=A0ABP7XE18_9FLAO